MDFTLRKDKTTQPPHYIVIFKAKAADNLEQAFREITAKTLTKEQRPSIRKVLTAAKPVSYTHLDVYKRQEHGHNGGVIGIVPLREDGVIFCGKKFIVEKTLSVMVALPRCV